MRGGSLGGYASLISWRWGSIPYHAPIAVESHHSEGGPKLPDFGHWARDGSPHQMVTGRVDSETR